MKKTTAIIAAKLVKTASKLKKTAATAAPGYLAERIDPDLLIKLGKINFPDGVILVTGTNGKTTTTKVLADLLKNSDISFVNNHAGSNLSRGVISSILTQANMRGIAKAKMGLFEVDEAYLEEVSRALKPNMIVVTNLFRDQLDRYGELDSLAEKFRLCFDKLKGTTLVLNADDPLVASLGMKLSSKLTVVYFGISDTAAFTPLRHDNTADSIVDPFSGETLTYTHRYFGHIGIYSANNSAFARPKPQIDVIKLRKDKTNNTIIDVKTTTQIESVSVNLAGSYNIYNVLPAFAVAELLGVKNVVLEHTLAEISAAFGRSESIKLGSINLDLYLIKNPTGFNQVIQSFIIPNPNTPILLAINDNIADGRDVSWLWDSAVEDFAGHKAPIVVSGQRALDMQLRLVYAGYKGNIVCLPDLAQALQAATKLTKNNNLMVLPTYTAMLSLRELINAGNKEGSKEFWQ